MRGVKCIGLLLALACALGQTACGNPVRDDLISSLGHENPNVRRGPLHRPGQPCLACHSPNGHREPYMSVAGTIYQSQDKKLPARDVVVQLTDSQNRTYAVATNCAGNFYVQADDFTPVYPMTVKLQYANLQILQMKTKIYREGSCAACHKDPAGPTSVGFVYVSTDPSFVFPPGCR